MSAAAGTTAEIVSGAAITSPDTCGWHVTIDRTGPTPVAMQMRGNPDHPFTFGHSSPLLYG